MVATKDIGAQVGTLLTGPAWSGQRVVELGSMVTADEVAKQLGEVLTRDVKAFAIPRAGWAEAFEQSGIPKDHTGPAEEMFEAVNAGIERGVDSVIVDTAGRLHTKVGLMDELGKIKRVIEKHGSVDEVLLVLDATTGQNGLRPARVFAEVVDITGIILTKLDGTAKGGIVIQVQRELGVPVKLVGLGEGPDDLAFFDPEVFIDAILAD